MDHFDRELCYTAGWKLPADWTGRHSAPVAMRWGRSARSPLMLCEESASWEIWVTIEVRLQPLQWDSFSCQEAWPDWIPLRIGEWIKPEKGSRFVLVITYSPHWAVDLRPAVSAKSTPAVCTVWMLKRLQTRGLRHLRTTFRNNLHLLWSNHSSPVKQKCFLGLLHCL